MPVKVNVEYSIGGGGCRYGDTWLPADFTVTLEPIVDAKLNVGVRLAMRASAEDGPVCREVAVYSTVDDGGVPARALRGFKLEDWVERACMHAAQTLVAEGDGFTTWGLPEVGEGAAVRTDVRKARKTARGTGYTKEFLREVADVYNAGGATPTKAVREAFSVAQSTAQLYVSHARNAGLVAATKKVSK